MYTCKLRLPHVERRTCRPSALARALTDSVFPVPAGPYGLPPYLTETTPLLAFFNYYSLVFQFNFQFFNFGGVFQLHFSICQERCTWNARADRSRRVVNDTLNIRNSRHRTSTPSPPRKERWHPIPSATNESNSQ